MPDTLTMPKQPPITKEMKHKIISAANESYYACLLALDVHRRDFDLSFREAVMTAIMDWIKDHPAPRQKPTRKTRKDIADAIQLAARYLGRRSGIRR